jgi:hypothetical protein
MMVDWTMLSPTYLTAMVEWAGAVLTVLAIGQDQAMRKESRTVAIPTTGAREERPAAEALARPVIRWRANHKYDTRCLGAQPS